jgi:hypothetical protein
MPRDVVEKHVEPRGEIDARRARLPRSYNNRRDGILTDSPSIPDLEFLAPLRCANDLELVTEPAVIFDRETQRTGGYQAPRGHDRPLGDVDVKRLGHRGRKRGATRREPTEGGEDEYQRGDGSGSASHLNRIVATTASAAPPLWVDETNHPTRVEGSRPEVLADNEQRQLALAVGQAAYGRGAGAGRGLPGIASAGPDQRTSRVRSLSSVEATN